jgi:pimeloyl-ACP methyl ester carboxylesterase
MNYGWRENVPKIKAPTLIVLGEFDNFEKRQDSWKALTVKDKLFVKVACGSHYLQYEKNRKALHQVSREWLLNGTVQGQKTGMLSADANGTIR